MGGNFPVWLRENWDYLHYRFLSAHEIHVTEGKQPATGKVVIFLIFPQNGLQQSHITTLRYFVDCGFSPLIVSNLPLTSNDLENLSPFAWKIVQRENFGYDFGGYREGILFLKDRIAGIDELVLANDSAWFPVGQGGDFISQAQHSGKHFFGTISCHGSKKRLYLEHSKYVEWDWDTNDKYYHVASFLLWLQSDLIRDPKFFSFWKRMRITKDKHKTVRRGEIGLTKFVNNNGYTSGTAIDLAVFDENISILEADELLEILESIAPDLADEEMDILAQQIEKFDQGEVWRRESQRMILTIATRHHAAYFSSLLLLKHLKGNFLKKALFPKTKESADRIFKLLDNYPQYFDAPIAQEIRSTFKVTHTE